MGKVSPKDGQSKTPKQKRRSRSTTGKYLRPGALAQLRYTKVSAAKSCTDLGKKRVAVITSDETKDQVVLQNNNVCETPTILSPVRFCYGGMHTPIDVSKQKNLQMTPKTPGALECTSESRLESLPMDLLVIQARLFHFNYTTPDRMRQEMLRTMTPLPTDHWPFVSKDDGKGAWLPSPHTPKAPKHGARPPSRLKFTEMRQIAAVLFQESVFPSRCLVPSVIQKPLCKSLGSNRVLFYEDELCQAVAQNKLR
uniref:F-box protein At4g35930 isoform X2 n=1 Tax=Nicotiana sylvestris TaxID=4096 RepID=A0A1U7XSM3_NICSY|nr:PREDICTED: F-box protein At4g35930 isoform X2 [Nicotiana sylvestris]